MSTILVFIYAPLLEQKVPLRNIFALKHLRNNHDAMFYFISTERCMEQPRWCNNNMAGIAGAAERVNYGTLSVKALGTRTVTCVRLFISIKAFHIFKTLVLQRNWLF